MKKNGRAAGAPQRKKKGKERKKWRAPKARAGKMEKKNEKMARAGKKWVFDYVFLYFF